MASYRGSLCHLRGPLQSISWARSTQGSLRLPVLSQLRPSTHHGCQPRHSSHPSPTAHGVRCLHLGTVLESGVHLAQESLLAIHATTGLPWYFVIPLFALGVNLTVRLPLQIYSRKIILARSRLQPIVGTWAAFHKLRRQEKLSRALYTGKSQARLCKERGLQIWKAWAPSLSIAPWIMATDATRRMTGAGGGIISLVSGQYIQEHRQQLQQQQQQQQQQSQGLVPATTAQPVEGIPLSDTDSSVSLTTAAPDAQLPADVSSFLEPSMATGGTLWFPDLTVPDPYIILPILWSATLCWALIPETPAARRAFFNMTQDVSKLTTVANTSTPWALRLRRAALLVSIGMPLIAMYLPAGMLLYVVSSSLWTQLNGWILNRYMPFESPFATPPMALEKGWVKPPK
ncbi:hypothetical protein SODALDRAFT_42793 [Sodiomyces alkalinus F11]|uniref:Mitochondrial export translocase Oxa2 n=1 Tax=Sodiomyces alkalinus (strain CBS 110278 / VKM F-3762 / F11) TaxID=1314773 RepID=A0A3N2QA93_SODAK|nr:hypothetical protein SODALDRAFT_42793 [Sodiomyces alkalinus F11]ROT43588.1 hypothetical protein SODALDRAFT_42793 [Sodiomyces alkalinus F11]